MRRHGVVEPTQKLEPFLVTMPLLAEAIDFAVGRIERRKQGCGAVAFVVMGQGLAATALERQAGLGTISRAWIWLFSSTHSTRACWGGFRYKPTMSSSFSAKAGSLLILKLSTRCGFRPWWRQMRRTLASLIPAAAAMVRVLQWVALGGFWRVVMLTTRRMKLAPILGVRPGRGASFSPPPRNLWVS